MTTETVQMTVKKQELEFKNYLMSAMPSLKGIASKYMDAERLVRIALVARAKTPLLMKCSKESILTSLMQAAEMGLEPNTPLQHAALVPRRNRRTGMYEAQFMAMYRGLIELGRRNGVLRTARAVPIYTCDEYNITEGLTHTIEHKPKFDHADFGDPGKVIMVYAVAQLVGGDTEWTYMTAMQIRRIQNRSPAGKDGPWVTDWEEMAKKTVLRRLFKLLPMSTALAKAMEHEEKVDDFDLTAVAEAAAASAEEEADDNVIPLQPGAAGEIEAPKDSGTELAEALKKKSKEKAPAEKPPKGDGGGSGAPPQGSLLS